MSPSPVPLYNRCEALELDGQVNDSVVKGPSWLEGSPKASQPTLHIIISFVMKKKEELLS